MNYSGARQRRGALMAVAYVLWGLLLFVIFMVIYFPYDVVLAAKLAPMGLRLSYQQARFRLPLGVGLQNVKFLAIHPSPWKSLESQELTLQPVLTSLLSSAPALAIGAQLYGGRTEVLIARAGPAGYRVHFDAMALDLARLARLADAGVGLSGKLSASGLFDLDQRGAANATGRFEFHSKNVALRFGTGILSVTFTELAGVFALRPGILDVQHLTGRGPDLGLDAQGVVRLGPSMALSTVNMTCQLTPTAAGRARLGVFLRMLPHPPGASAYLIRGPLTMPSIS